VVSHKLRVLNVDLTNEKTAVEILDSSVAKRFIGGRGVGAYLLYNCVPCGADPWSPENALVVSTGAGVDTGIPGANRVAYITKSAHRSFSFSHSGGHFATALKRSGYDHLVVTGKANKPVYLLIDGEKVSIKDARHLWGKLVWETDALIKRDVGRNVLVGAIGPGGENLVPFSSFINDYHVAAKGGAGYVAGSKRLKAIVVTRSRGKAKLDDKRVSSLASFIKAKVRNSPTGERFSSHGSLNFVLDHYNLGAISGYNYTRNNVSEEGIKAYHAEIFAKNIKVRNETCYGCPVGCNQIYQVKEDIPDAARSGKLEWSSLCALGSMLGIFDYGKLIPLVWLSAQLGIDAKETGSLIGMLMEMYEKGIISERDTNGLKMTWGNAEAAREMIKAIAYKTGVGAALGEGAEGVLNRFGEEAKRCYGWAKGCGISGSDVRADYSWGLGHAVCVRGPDHVHHYSLIARSGRKDLAKKLFDEEKAADRLNPEAKGRVVWWSENYKAIVDSLGYCIFLAQSVLRIPPDFVDFFAEVLSASFGEEISPLEIFKMGERIVQVDRAFNSREGFSRAEDSLPYRFTEIPAPDEPIRGSTVPLSHPGMLDEYYAWRGCNREGIVTLDRLREVGLEEMAGELRSVGKLSEEKQLVSFRRNRATKSLSKKRSLAELEKLIKAAPMQKVSSKFKYIEDHPLFTG
jgi:aldehyde:ferredoxin oxidoreductase